MIRFLKAALTALAMLTVMLVSAAITLRIVLHGREVTIPDLAGMTVAEASEAALKIGVDLNVENRFYSTTVPVGRILSQAPAAGSTVRHGWQVRVTESLGPQQVTIPNVVGQPVQQASMNIRKMQLDLGTLAHIEAPGDAEMTLAQTPPPNAGVDQPRVNLLLSSVGSAATTFVMPSLVGMSFEAADREAAALGLKIVAGGDVPEAQAPGTPGAAPPPPIASSEVVVGAQSPESGFRASKGEVLRLTVQLRAPAAATTSSTR